MLRTTAVVLMAMAVNAPLWAAQAPNPNLNNYEVHLIRGLAQRQTVQMSYDQLALEKASSELTRQVAQRALELHTAGQTSISELGKKLAVWGAVGQGPMNPMSSAPRAGGAARGGPPGGFNTPPGGRFDEALKNTTGGEFDRLYLLLTILQNEEMQRAMTLEIESAGKSTTNAELLAWCRERVESYRGLARVVQKAARGEGDTVDNPLNRERGAADAPPRT